MPVTILTQANRPAVSTLLENHAWCVACLCAAWCNVCTSFRAEFETLAERHPEKIFLWIDVEDESDLVGDIDVDNFPALLIEHNGLVDFLGAIEPNMAIAHRLIEAQTKAVFLGQSLKTSDGKAEGDSKSNSNSMRARLQGNSD